jgi:DNA invertase Pin-like site-specific DNA recombinase
MINTILSIATQKEVSVYAIKGNWHLDNSIQSKIIAMAFSMAAEIERELISQRTKEALRVRKENGMKLGRPKVKVKVSSINTNQRLKHYSRMVLQRDLLLRRYKVSEQALYNWLGRRRE